MCDFLLVHKQTPSPAPSQMVCSPYYSTSNRRGWPSLSWCQQLSATLRSRYVPPPPGATAQLKPATAGFATNFPLPHTLLTKPYSAPLPHSQSPQRFSDKFTTTFPGHQRSFGFLRAGKFTVSSVAEFNLEEHLSLADVAVDSHFSPSMLRVRIKQTRSAWVSWQGTPSALPVSGVPLNVPLNQRLSTRPSLPLCRWLILLPAAAGGLGPG